MSLEWNGGTKEMWRPKFEQKFKHINAQLNVSQNRCQWLIYQVVKCGPTASTDSVSLHSLNKVVKTYGEIRNFLNGFKPISNSVVSSII